MPPFYLATARPGAATRPAAGQLALPLGADATRWYWGNGAIHQVMGWGAAHRVEAAGPDRFRRLAEGMASALATGIEPVAGAQIAAIDLPWFLGFGFWDGPAWPGFPSAVLTLPETGVIWRSDASPLVWALARGGAAAEAAAAEAARLLDVGRGMSGEPDAGLPALSTLLPDDLERRIAGALVEIRSGLVQKAVLAGARLARRSDGRDWDALVLLQRRMQAEPDSFHYLFSPTPGLAWLGATPERLVARRGDKLETMALAGSRPRHADPVTDAALGRQLLHSVKDRAEHGLVVEAIRQGLLGMGLQPRVAGPRLRRLANLQHLQSVLVASVRPAMKLLELVALLHPTPALGGWPRGAALEVIERHESLPDGRGWYGGGVGWLDGRGQGDISVGIRGLLIRGGLATAYAGAGLVEGSDPAAEMAEIRVKMTAAMSALTVT